MEKDIEHTRTDLFQEYRENVDITLYKSHLASKETQDGEEKYYGRIKRHVVDIKNIIAETKDMNTGISQSIMYHVASILKKGMLDFLERGYAINLFDIGIVYITVKGAITKSMSKSEIAEHIHLSFTPLRESEEKVSSLIVKNISDYKSPRIIYKVVNLWDDKYPENTVTLGKVGEVRGKNIQLGATGSSMYFAESDENGKVITDPADHIECNKIISNKTDSISFFIPENLNRDKKYIIVIETNLTVSGKESKTTNIIKSGLITVL